MKALAASRATTMPNAVKNLHEPVALVFPDPPHKCGDRLDLPLTCANQRDSDLRLSDKNLHQFQCLMLPNALLDLLSAQATLHWLTMKYRAIEEVLPVHITITVKGIGDEGLPCTSGAA